jgi:hypothetical protein
MSVFITAMDGFMFFKSVDVSLFGLIGFATYA